MSVYEPKSFSGNHDIVRYIWGGAWISAGSLWIWGWHLLIVIQRPDKSWDLRMSLLTLMVLCCVVWQADKFPENM